MASLVASWFQETTGLEEPLSAIAELLIARLVTIFATSMSINDPVPKLTGFVKQSRRIIQNSGSYVALILSAIVSAVDIGSISRFTYAVYAKGDKAFRVVYLTVRFSFRLVIMILEICVGSSIRSTSHFLSDRQKECSRVNFSTTV